MEKTIKSCPFCGGEAKATDIDLLGWWHVECVDCKAQSRTFERRKKAAAAWNARAERTCSVKTGYVDGREMWYECSECGLTDYALRGDSTMFDYAYCPNCGARVKEER